jgi:hypothetical protein
MQYTQIALRPDNQEDMSFLLDLHRETMDAHLVGSGLSFSVEEQGKSGASFVERIGFVVVEGAPHA